MYTPSERTIEDNFLMALHGERDSMLRAIDAQISAIQSTDGWAKNESAISNLVQLTECRDEVLKTYTKIFLPISAAKLPKEQ